MTFHNFSNVRLKILLASFKNTSLNDRTETMLYQKLNEAYSLLFGNDSLSMLADCPWVYVFKTRMANGNVQS